MNNKKNLDKDTEKELGILRQLDKNPSTSQRDLAEEIGVSLGKINFLYSTKNKLKHPMHWLPARINL